VPRAALGGLYSGYAKKFTCLRVFNLVAKKLLVCHKVLGGDFCRKRCKLDRVMLGNCAVYVCEMVN
jgi:hypothetical protein